MKLSYDIEHTLAILIGTGNYLTEDFMQIKPVKGNLEDLRNLLLDKDIFGLPEERIVILEDKTHLEILKTLKLELGKANLKTVIIYYSGHGHRTSKDRLFLTASNSEKDFDLIKGTAIEFTDFKNIIENSPGKPISIIIIDACYSGIAAQSDNALTDEERSIKGACIITSSSNKEQSFFDENAKHTFFTDELIEILGKGSEKSEECLSINDIYNNLQNNLRSKNISEPQRRDNLDSGVFFFARNKKFNKEFFIRKAEEHFNRGNYSRALEYYFTLLEKFNDAGYSEQIEKCQKEIDYARLIDEGESLYHNKDYEPALNKFIEAQKIKSETLLLLKIKKCEYEIKLETEVLRRIEEKRLSEQEKHRLEKEKAELEKKEAEENRQKHEEDLKRKHEVDLKRKQEDDLKRKNEDEQKRKQEDELKKKQEDELKRIQLEELKRRHAEEIKRKNEEDLKRKHEEEIKRKNEEDLKRKHEEELKRKLDEKLKTKQQEDLKRKHEGDLIQKQEDVLKQKEEFTERTAERESFIKKYKTIITLASILILLISTYLIFQNNSSFKDSSKIVFEKEKIDLGKVSQGPPLEFSYKFTNKGESPLIIEKIQPSCGCTVANTDGKNEYSKDESGEIKVSFNTQGRSGKQEKNVVVYTNDPDIRQKILNFSCEIDITSQE